MTGRIKERTIEDDRRGLEEELKEMTAGRTVKDFKGIIGDKDYRGRTVREERKEDTRRGHKKRTNQFKRTPGLEEKDKSRC